MAKNIKVIVDEDDYVCGYCDLGDINGGLEVAYPETEEDFCLFYTAYRYSDGSLHLDETKKEEIINSMENLK